MQAPFSEQALYEHLLLGYYSFLLIGIELRHPGTDETEYLALRIGPFSEADCCYCRDRLERAAREVMRYWSKRVRRPGVTLAECVRLKVRAYPASELASELLTVPRVALVGEYLRLIENGTFSLAGKCLAEWTGTGVKRWALRRY